MKLTTYNQMKIIWYIMLPDLQKRSSTHIKVTNFNGLFIYCQALQ